MLKHFGFLTRSFHITIEILHSKKGIFLIPNVSNYYDTPFKLYRRSEKA